MGEADIVSSFNSGPETGKAYMAIAVEVLPVVPISAKEELEKDGSYVVDSTPNDKALILNNEVDPVYANATFEVHSSLLGWIVVTQ